MSMSLPTNSIKERVDHKTNQKLDWGNNPRGTWLTYEMVHSDAFRSLTKIESDIWIFIQLRKQYPSNKKKKRNYWAPINRDKLYVPIVAISDFFDGSTRGMKINPPSMDSIRKSFLKFMTVGFLSLKHQGGSGKGDMNIYQLENHWRLWKKGDPPCFTKAGMSREKGFCVPDSGVFNNRPRQKRQERGARTGD